MKYKSIYVAATSQHVGKTTSTLGLVSSFLRKGLNVGYSKPVGQKHLNFENIKVDKDTILFADLIHFQIVPELHSPVILGQGAVEKFLEDPELHNYEARVYNAKQVLESRHEVVIYEGTGHPGVGSVVGLSNARVAKMLDAGVVMIVEGGIGSTIDMLNMSTSLFREEGVEIIGVIINKVLPDKLEKVRYYVGKWMEENQIKLLGLIPYDPALAFPIIRTIAESIRSEITHFENMASNRVSGILAGSLIELKELKSSEDLLLVVSTNSIKDAIDKILWLSKLFHIGHCPLSGIVVSGSKPLDESVLKYINDNEIPVIRTDLDTYEAVIKISKIEVKINQNTPWKVQKAIKLIEENVDLEYIIQSK
ncbi:MAG: AAA family ATPase [Saprospiraceae bacterium]|nr:AAA family ATPase [Saprospiraceae bacterium]